MGTRKTQGFTVIETMLFLAISGVLVVTMIIGVGASIQIQRYRDSVETFKTLLQDQYSEIASVNNDRTDDWSCNAAAQTLQNGTEIRGQSRCVVLGRYVSIVGSDVSIYSVIGYPSATPTATGNDIAKLRANYALNVSTVSVVEKTLEWGAEIAWPRTGPDLGSQRTPRSLSILFIRSPDSGLVYTFTSNATPTTPTPASLLAMVVSGETKPGQAARTICVYSGALTGPSLAVYLYPYANGPTSIETRSNDFMADPASNSLDKAERCFDNGF